MTSCSAGRRDNQQICKFDRYRLDVGKLGLSQNSNASRLGFLLCGFA